MYEAGNADSRLKLAAIFLDDTQDTEYLVSLVRKLSSIDSDLSVLIARANGKYAAIEAEAEHVEYLDSSTLKDALRQGLKSAAPDRRILVFFKKLNSNTSISMVNGWLEKKADFVRRQGLIILSENYARHIAETGDEPSIRNAIAGGFTVPLSLPQMLLFPREAMRQNWTLAKFLMVGLSGVVVNEVLLTLLRIWIPTVFANAVAVEASILSNFVLNDTFTFQAGRKSSTTPSPNRIERKTTRLVKYNIVSLVGLTVNFVVFYVLYSNKVFYVWSSLVAILVAFAINYLGSSKWAWKNILRN